MKVKVAIISISSLLLIGLYFFAANAFKGSEEVRLGSLAEVNQKLFIPDHAPRLGDKNAPVKLVEFLDPECETCRVFYPYVKQILLKFEGKVELVVRYAPFHRNSINAVKVLEATRIQNKYWESLELLFANQPYWADHHDPRPERIWELLPQVSVDVEQAKKDMNRPEIEEIIRKDMADLKELGVRRTPSFFVNGKPLLEFGLEPLVALIEQELEASK